jgi:hypothetical protein
MTVTNSAPQARRSILPGQRLSGFPITPFVGRN